MVVDSCMRTQLNSCYGDAFSCIFGPMSEGLYFWSHKILTHTTLLGFAVSASFIFILALGFLAAFLYLCHRIWTHCIRVQHDKYKDPKSWPLLGSQLEASWNYDRLLDWITSFFSDDHRTVKMSFLWRHSYLTVDPANVEHILKTNFPNYPKGQESHHRLFDLLGNGILNTDGNMWKAHRKLASLEFSMKKLKKLSSTVYRNSALKLVELLDECSNEGVDVQDLLLNMTFSSICEVVFGSEITKGSICADPFIASTLDSVQEMITRRYVFPWWRLQRLFNIGSERILRRDIKRFNKFLSCIIKQKMSRLQEKDQNNAGIGNLATTQDINGYTAEGVDAEDLLSRIILHVRNKASTDLCNKNVQKTDKIEQMEEEVQESIMSFVMAGRDTIASTLSWFLYCMCINPHMQEEVFQELIKLESNYESSDNTMITCKVDKSKDYGDNSRKDSRRAHHMNEFAEKVLSYEALQSSHTPYLHAALAETLRLYPAVPRDGKVALKDDVLPDGTKIKAGDQVAYIPYAMGRMPFLWGNDVLLFKPERWLIDGTFKPQSPFKFVAFQAGPRMCLGKDAAYLQMKITAAMLLRFFHFQLVPNHPVQYKMMMVMTMKYGLMVNVTPR